MKREEWDELTDDERWALFVSKIDIIEDTNSWLDELDQGIVHYMYGRQM